MGSTGMGPVGSRPGSDADRWVNRRIRGAVPPDISGSSELPAADDPRCVWPRIDHSHRSDVHHIAPIPWDAIRSESLVVSRRMTEIASIGHRCIEPGRAIVCNSGGRSVN